MKKYTIFLLFCLLTSVIGCGDRKPGTSDKNDSLPYVKKTEIDGREMVLIPVGEFIMGTNKTDPENTHQKIGTVKPLYLDQHPERKLYLQAYYIDRYEVTNSDYSRFIEATLYPDFPSHWKDGKYPEEKGNHPVTNVIWQEALTYCLWAHKQLPTEAQWEKAARGPNGFLYPWGNEYRKGKANVGIEAVKGTAPVGSYKEDVSPYGVYDMEGNVMEWTLDWYLPYPGNEYKNSRFGKMFKVLRGNGFQKAGHYFLDAYKFTFNRTEVPPDEYFENVGFRCATPLIKAK